MANTNQSTTNPLSALVGIDFRIFETDLHAGFEKRGSDGYAILVMPTNLEADNGISVGKMIQEIKGLVSSIDENANTDDMEKDLQSGVSGLSRDDGQQFDLNKLMIKLRMAFLYICKTAEESTIEYAFQLEVTTEGMIPEKIRSLVDVNNVSISVWNTQRKKLIEKMSLVTANDYLGIAKQQSPEPEPQPKQK